MIGHVCISIMCHLLLESRNVRVLLRQRHCRATERKTYLGQGCRTCLGLVKEKRLLCVNKVRRTGVWEHPSSCNTAGAGLAGDGETGYCAAAASAPRGDVCILCHALWPSVCHTYQCVRAHGAESKLMVFQKWSLKWRRRWLCPNSLQR